MSESSRTLIFVSVLIGFLLTFISAETCNQSGSCSCEFNGWKIDLSPLTTLMKDSKPLFIVSNEHFLFNFNPCQPFHSDALNCKNDTDLAVNRVDGNGNCTVIGNQKSASFKGDTSNVDGIYLEYSSERSSTKHVAKVYLECNNEQSFAFVKQEVASPLTYVFKLKTIYACKPVNHQLSGGSVLLILVMVAATIYLVGGFLFKHFYLHAQGVEIIPNYSFWSDFPLLVRDGCYFTFRGCQGPTTYERI